VPVTTIQGYRIHYRDKGKGRPVLLIHGLAGASGFWADTLEALPQGFRGLAPDLLGFGDSEKPRIDYTIHGHAERVRDLAGSLGIHEFDLIGHSMGGMVALLVTCLSPDKVGRLVLVNIPVSGGRALHGRGRIGATLPGILLVKAGLQIPWILWLLRRIKRYYFVLDPRFVADARKASTFSLNRHAKALRRTDLSMQLGEIAVPTLVIGTDEDGIVRPSQFNLAAKGIPGAKQFWVRGAGHCPTLEKPEESHKAIFDFLLEKG